MSPSSPLLIEGVPDMCFTFQAAEISADPVSHHQHSQFRDAQQRIGNSLFFLVILYLHLFHTSLLMQVHLKDLIKIKPPQKL